MNPDKLPSSLVTQALHLPKDRHRVRVSTLKDTVPGANAYAARRLRTYFISAHCRLGMVATNGARRSIVVG
jgi:hypothetical protein